MKKLFVTADVHGYYNIMMDELKERGFEIENPEHIILICGDAFDRGNEAVKMLEFLLKMRDQKRLILIRGNHADLLLRMLNEIKQDGKPYSSVHYSNGTVGTLVQIVGDKVIDAKLDFWMSLTSTEKRKITQKMKPLVDLIKKDTVDYYEYGDYIFTHGWLPCEIIQDWGHSNPRRLIENWRQLKPFDNLWEQARWINGGEAWKNKCREPNKTVVCGHWHCSWGHSHLHHALSEDPQPSHQDWDLSYRPFFDDGIIMIDACTARSKRVNVLVFDMTEDKLIPQFVAENPIRAKKM